MLKLISVVWLFFKGRDRTKEYVLIKIYMQAYECVFRGKGCLKIDFFACVLNGCRLMKFGLCCFSNLPHLLAMNTGNIIVFMINMIEEHNWITPFNMNSQMALHFWIYFRRFPYLLRIQCKAFKSLFSNNLEESFV